MHAACRSPSFYPSAPAVIFQHHATLFKDSLSQLLDPPERMSLFPDPRRIVTGHDEAGRAIVVADSTVPCEPTPVKCNFAGLYETHQFPESNDDWVDPIKERTKSLANDNGVVLRVVDFPPNTETVGWAISNRIKTGTLYFAAGNVLT
jgi:hypothetical protein